VNADERDPLWGLSRKSGNAQEWEPVLRFPDRRNRLAGAGRVKADDRDPRQPQACDSVPERRKNPVRRQPVRVAASGRGPTGSCRPPAALRLQKPFALRFLARQLACPANRLGPLACLLLGRFLEMLLELHFAKHPLALKFLLQRPKRLIDVVVTNANLHVVVTTFLAELHGVQDAA